MARATSWWRGGRPSRRLPFLRSWYGLSTGRAGRKEGSRELMTHPARVSTVPSARESPSSTALRSWSGRCGAMGRSGALLGGSIRRANPWPPPRASTPYRAPSPLLGPRRSSARARAWSCFAGAGAMIFRTMSAFSNVFACPPDSCLRRHPLPTEKDAGRALRYSRLDQLTSPPAPGSRAVGSPSSPWQKSVLCPSIVALPLVSCFTNEDDRNQPSIANGLDWAIGCAKSASDGPTAPTKEQRGRPGDPGGFAAFRIPQADA